MSVILQPSRAFPLVRQIANHTDSSTYYVRAIVRDADGTTIDTLDLEDKTGQRFQISYRVPADPSGQGRYISVVTSVYTDSGYTTKSQNYGDEETTYLIFDRVMPAMRGGGGGNLGGGGSLDSGTIRRIVSEELEKAKPEPIEIPEVEMPTMRFDEVLGAIQKVTKAIKAVPTEKVDLSGVLQGLTALAGKIDDKEVTPEADLQPIVEAVQDIQKNIGEGFADLATIYTESERRLLGSVEKKIGESMESMELTIAPTVSGVQKKTPEAQPTPFDLNKFVS